MFPVRAELSNWQNGDFHVIREYTREQASCLLLSGTYRFKSSSPVVTMMQTSQSFLRDHNTCRDRTNSRIVCFFLQSEVRAVGVVIANIFRKQPLKSTGSRTLLPRIILTNFTFDDIYELLLAWCCLTKLLSVNTIPVALQIRLLQIKFQTELQFTGFPESAGNFPIITGTNIGIGSLEMWMVEGIERFRAEFKAHAFAEPT